MRASARGNVELERTCGWVGGHSLSRPWRVFELLVLPAQRSRDSCQYLFSPGAGSKIPPCVGVFVSRHLIAALGETTLVHLLASAHLPPIQMDSCCEPYVHIYKVYIKDDTASAFPF